MKKIDDDDLVDVTGGVGTPQKSSLPTGSGDPGGGDGDQGDDHGGVKIPD